MMLLSSLFAPVRSLFRVHFRAAKAFLTCLAAGLLLMLAAHSASARATILNSSPTAHAGDVIYVQGDSFGTGPKAQYSYDGSHWATLPLISSGTYQGAGSITAQIPTGVAQTGVLEVKVTPDNGSSWSNIVLINQAHAMSYDTPEVASGSPFRIYGRNLLYPGLTPTVRLVNGSNSLTATVNTSGSTPYVLNVTAPSGVLTGVKYTVMVSNGFTGTGAETKADEPLNGRAGGADVWQLGLPWGADFSATSTNVYNVQNDPRLTQNGQPLFAVGDGNNNDQPAIQNAINIAAASPQGGGVVYLPAGIYKLVYDPTTFGLMIKSNVVLAGAGNNLTTIEYGFGPAPQLGYQGFGVMFGDGWNPVSKCGVADVTIQNMDTSGQWLENLLLDNSSGGISSETFMQRVHVRSTYGNQTLVGNIDRLAIENSDFSVLGDPVDNTVLLGGTLTNYVCRSNTYEWSGGQATALGGVTNGVIENNTYTRNCDYTKYPKAINTRAFDNSALTNVAILNNTFSVLYGPPYNNNDGETCLVEDVNGSVDSTQGTVTSATATTLTDTLQSFPANIVGGPGSLYPSFPVASVMIVRGTGTGQWRNITAVSADGHTLMLDPKNPWTVPPTSGANGSRYATFAWGAVNTTVAANNLSGGRAGIAFGWCPIHDVLIDGNTVTNCGGIGLEPVQLNEPPYTLGSQVPPYTNRGQQFHPDVNVQITNNAVSETDGNKPAYIGILADEDGDLRPQYNNNNFGVLALGVEMRGNAVTGGIPNFDPVNKDPNDSPIENEGYYAWEYGYSYLSTDDGTPAILDAIFQNDTANHIDNLMNYTNPAFPVGGSVNEAAYTLASGDYQTVIFNPVNNIVKNLLFDNVLPYLNFPAGPHASVNTTLSNIWTDGDVGTTYLAGSAGTLGSSGTNSNVFTVQGGGGDIWGSNDGFNFCAQTTPTGTAALTGNGTITARVTSVGGSNYAKAGVMIRADLTPGSVFADTIIEANGVSGGDYRTMANSGTLANGGISNAYAPYWVKVTRVGSMFTSSLAPDNNGVPGTWTKSGSPVPITMPATVYAGLVVSSANGGGLNTSTLDHVTVTTP